MDLECADEEEAAAVARVGVCNMSDIAEVGVNDTLSEGDVVGDAEDVVAGEDNMSVVSEDPGDLKRFCFSERVSKALTRSHVTNQEFPGSRYE